MNSRRWLVYTVGLSADDRLAKIQELRAELAELQNALGEVEIAEMHACKAVSLRYIAMRIREIAQTLAQLDADLIGPAKQEPQSK